METKKHFVLVHGSCHGAWCWYKLMPLLKQAGHQVTALDLGGSGINPKQLHEITSISEYLQPLMEFMASLTEYEKVILVGHSFGGFSISLAMQKFTEKILVAVFVTAFMPSCVNPPATLLHEIMRRNGDSPLDCEVVPGQNPESPPISWLVGPEYLANVLYTKCQPEDLELAKVLVRPSKFFSDDLDKESLLTETKYGSVKRVFVVCEEDGVLKEDYQKWMIENCPTQDVKKIEGAAHMAMLTKPKELCQCLLDIASQ